MAVQQTLRDMVYTVTPEEAKRRREMAAALTRQGQGAINDTWSGLRVGTAALLGGIENKRAARAEAEGAAARNAAFSSMLDGLGGGSAMGSGGFGSSPAMSYSGSDNVGTASLPEGERASYIRNGLIERGMPEHIADAFVVNFQDESGLDSGINEANPIVPGSRGGYGLYQLTGPRRRAYEQFASERGVNVADPDAQLDFLMYELQGPESRAAQRIFSAPDTATAAQYIVNDFLRPAPEHRNSRSARYARLPNSAPSQMAYQGTPAATGAMGAVNQLAATPAPPNAGVQVASLEPGAGLDSALGAGSVRATNPVTPGMVDAPVTNPEEAAMLEQLRARQGYNPANVVSASRPGMVGGNTPSGPGMIGDVAPAAVGAPAGAGMVDAMPDQYMQSQPPVVPQSGPQPYQISQGPAPYQMPNRVSQQQQLAELLRGGQSQAAPAVSQDRIQLARQLLANPWTADMGQQMVMDLVNQQPQERWETIAGNDGSIWQRNSLTGELEQVQGAPEQEDPYMTVGGQIYDRNTGTWIAPPQQAPANVQAIEWGARQLGYQPGTPEYQDYVRTQMAPRPGVQVNMPGQPNIGTIPQGYQAIQGPDGQWTMAPIPGGPAAAEAEQDSARRDMLREQELRQADVVTEDIDRVLGMVDNSTLPVTGAGSWLSSIPGTAAHDVSNVLDTIKANVGFDKLQAMREASPTGGALGSVSEFENRLLQATLGSLQQSQSEEQFRYNLNRLYNIYMDMVHGIGKGPERRRLGGQNNEGATGILPEDVSEDDIQFTMEKYKLTRAQVLERLLNGS